MEIELQDDGSTITLDGVTINDQKLYDILEPLDQSARETIISTVLNLGSTEIIRRSTSADVQLIKGEFESLQSTFKNMLTSAATDLSKKLSEIVDVNDKNSKMAQFLSILDDVTDKRNPLAKFLDLQNEHSPLAIFKAEITQKLQDINNLVEYNQGKTDEHQFNPQKGVEFEEELHEFLLHHQIHDDKITLTGTKGEAFGKKGDLEIELDQTEFSEKTLISVEAKEALPGTNRSLTGADGYIAYLTQVIEQRKSQFGILVVRDPECLNKSSKEKLEHFLRMGNMIFCTYEIDGIFVKMAYTVARLILSMGKQSITGKSTEEKVAAVKCEIDVLYDMIRRFSAIKSSLTTINKTCDKVKEQIDKLKDDIESKVTSIKKIME